MPDAWLSKRERRMRNQYQDTLGIDEGGVVLDFCQVDDDRQHFIKNIKVTVCEKTIYS